MIRKVSINMIRHVGIVWWVLSKDIKDAFSGIILVFSDELGSFFGTWFHVLFFKLIIKFLAFFFNCTIAFTDPNRIITGITKRPI